MRRAILAGFCLALLTASTWADSGDATRAAKRRAESQQQVTYAQSQASDRVLGDTLQPAHLVLILILGGLYFLPLWVAAVRKCKAGAGIGIVNIFLGWTFVGWVVALAWAASGEKKPNPLPVAPVV